MITANTYSKSALRVAAEGLVAGHDDVDYFPSYEIVSHSERALTYGDDCRHVARPVVTAIVDRMVAQYVPGAVDETAAAAEPAVAETGPIVDGTRRRVADATKSGDYAKAIRALKTLEGGGWDAAGYGEFGFRLEFARVLMRDAQVLEAEQQLSRALELEPESTIVLLGLARARRKLGRRREAEACMARAVEISPEDAQFRYLLAADMARNRRHTEATPQLMRCLALQPDHAEAKALLDDCNRRLAADWLEAEPEPDRPRPAAKTAKGGGLGVLAKGLFRRGGTAPPTILTEPSSAVRRRRPRAGRRVPRWSRRAAARRDVDGPRDASPCPGRAVVDADRGHAHRGAVDQRPWTV